MNSARKILSEIEAVRARLDATASEWNATDVPGIERAVRALEASLEPLETTVKSHGINSQLPAAELRTAAQGLKQQAAALERMVDAAAAFLRSNSFGISGNCDAYPFAGELSPAAAAPTESYAG
jgi:hypothetical protein